MHKVVSGASHSRYAARVTDGPGDRERVPALRTSAAAGHIRPVAGLRRAALILLAAGAFGSVGLMGYVGRHQRSVLLMVLFTVWVLSPYATLAVAVALSGRWSVPTGRTLYALTIVVAVASLGIYGTVAFGPPRPQPAFYFIVVPPACWVLIAIVIPMAEVIAGRHAGRRA
jgi:hypothetical protein